MRQEPDKQVKPRLCTQIILSSGHVLSHLLYKLSMSFESLRPNKWTSSESHYSTVEISLKLVILSDYAFTQHCFLPPPIIQAV